MTFIIITWRRKKSIPYFHKMWDRKRRRNLSRTCSNSNKRSFYISLWYAHSIQTYSIIWKKLHFRLYTLLISQYNQEAFGFLNACTDQRNVFGLHKTNPLMIHCLLALSVRIESVLFFYKGFPPPQTDSKPQAAASIRDPLLNEMFTNYINFQRTMFMHRKGKIR